MIIAVGGMIMTEYTIDSMKNNIEKINCDVVDGHQSAIIQSDRGNMVVLSEEDYNSIQETLYLSSIPNLKKSILEADKETLEDCSASLDW